MRNFFLGNSFSSVLYGSATDAGLTATGNTPGLLRAAMGNVVTYGRHSEKTTLLALNIGGKGGLPQALSSASGGLKSVLGTLGAVLDVVGA